MTDLVWEEPLPARTAGPRGTLQPLLEQLHERPGEWALLRTFEDRDKGANFANALRQRAAKMKGDYQVAQRTRRGTGVTTVHARFLG